MLSNYWGSPSNSTLSSIPAVLSVDWIRKVLKPLVFLTLLLYQVIHPPGKELAFSFSSVTTAVTLTDRCGPAHRLQSWENWAYRLLPGWGALGKSLGLF